MITPMPKKNHPRLSSLNICKGPAKENKVKASVNYDKVQESKHTADDDDFDEFLESSPKTYQLNYYLKSTGVLDAKTMTKMTAPRCGVAVIL